MLGPIIQSLDFQSQALKLRAARQQVLAGNIVNADTPGYRAVDFDFAAALGRQASTAAGAGAALATERAGGVNLAPVPTQPGHIGGPAAAVGTHITWRTPGQAAIDSNTVDLDLERAQFAENAIRYEATLRFVSNDVKTLQAAMQSGGNG